MSQPDVLRKLKTNMLQNRIGLEWNDYTVAKQKATWYFGEIFNLASSSFAFERLKAEYDVIASKSTLNTELEIDPNIDVNSWTYLEKLSAQKKLKQYLRKSIQYLYLRDLGKDLSCGRTQKQIESVITKIVREVSRQTSRSATSQDVILKIATKYSVTSTYHWLMLKLADMKVCFSGLFPEQNEQPDGIRKLVKIVAGVVMHHLTGSPNGSSAQLESAIKLGYCYGLTYPFVDDLLDDSKILSSKDKATFNNMLRQSLLSGEVPDFPKFDNSSIYLKQVYDELKFAFYYIKETLEPAQASRFFNRAYVFFEAQDEDRKRRLLTAGSLSNEQLFIPVILKSSGSRLIVDDLISGEPNSDFDQRTFCFGIYNQFNDDIKDIFDDISENNITPYSYYVQYELAKKGMMSPYQIYWAVVLYLVEVVYKGNATVKHLILERSINAQRSLYMQVGKEKYNELRKSLLFTEFPEFDATIHALVLSPQSSAWFDKFISKQVSGYLVKNEEKNKKFNEVYDSLLTEINQQNQVEYLARYPKGKIHSMCEYVMEAGGKRMRPVIAAYMSKYFYHFSHEQRIETGKMLEYMHTASLILDDLPSQDNADFRRGKPTLHVRYDSHATAELAAVYLMMRAVEVQSSIKNHPPQAVLKSLSYAANITQLVCEGQLLDLNQKQVEFTVNDLESLYWLKTGLAIEASFVIPAILAEKDDLHISLLKKLAMHIGLAFQIKDDLLDTKGNKNLMGKPTNQDVYKASMVNLLGEEATREAMFSHYYEANRLVSEHFPSLLSFFEPLLDFIIYRSK